MSDDSPHYNTRHMAFESARDTWRTRCRDDQQQVRNVVVRWWDAFKSILPDEVQSARSTAKFAPLVAAVIAPMSTLLDIPALTQHWFIDVDGKWIKDSPGCVTLSSVGLFLNVVANLLLLMRFSSTKAFWKKGAQLSVVFWIAKTIIAIVNVSLFGAYREKHGDWRYAEAFWCAVASLVMAGTIAIALSYNIIFSYGHHASDLEDIRLTGRKFMLSVTFMMVLLGLSAFAFNRLEGWTYLDALYFSTQTALTVGYGDLVATKALSKVLVFVFAVLMISQLANEVSMIIDFIKARSQDKRDRWRKRYSEAMHREAIKRQPYATLVDEMALIHQINLHQEAIVELYDLMWSAVSLVAFWLVGAEVFHAVEGWGYGNAVYAVMVLSLTIGYGDYTPTTAFGRVFWIIYAMMAVPVVTNFAVQTVTGIMYTWSEHRFMRMRFRMERIQHPEVFAPHAHFILAHHEKWDPARKTYLDLSKKHRAADARVEHGVLSLAGLRPLRSSERAPQVDSDLPSAQQQVIGELLSNPSTRSDVATGLRAAALRDQMGDAKGGARENGASPRVGEDSLGKHGKHEHPSGDCCGGQDLGEDPTSGPGPVKGLKGGYGGAHRKDVGAEASTDAKRADGKIPSSVEHETGGGAQPDAPGASRSQSSHANGHDNSAAGWGSEEETEDTEDMHHGHDPSSASQGEAPHQVAAGPRLLGAQSGPPDFRRFGRHVSNAEKGRRLEFHMIKELIDRVTRLEAQGRQMLVDTMDQDLARTLLLADRNLQVRDAFQLYGDHVDPEANYRQEAQKTLEDERRRQAHLLNYESCDEDMLTRVARYRNTFAEILVLSSTLLKLEGGELKRFERWNVEDLHHERARHAHARGSDPERGHGGDGGDSGKRRASDVNPKGKKGKRSVSGRLRAISDWAAGKPHTNAERTERTEPERGLTKEDGSEQGTASPASASASTSVGSDATTAAVPPAPERQTCPTCGLQGGTGGTPIELGDAPVSELTPHRDPCGVAALRPTGVDIPLQDLQAQQDAPQTQGAHPPPPEAGDTNGPCEDHHLAEFVDSPRTPVRRDSWARIVREHEEAEHAARASLDNAGYGDVVGGSGGGGAGVGGVGGGAGVGDVGGSGESQRAGGVDGDGDDTQPGSADSAEDSDDAADAEVRDQIRRNEHEDAHGDMVAGMPGGGALGRRALVGAEDEAAEEGHPGDIEGDGGRGRDDKDLDDDLHDGLHRHRKPARRYRLGVPHSDADAREGSGSESGPSARPAQSSHPHSNSAHSSSAHSSSAHPSSAASGQPNQTPAPTHNPTQLPRPHTPDTHATAAGAPAPPDPRRSVRDHLRDAVWGHMSKGVFRDAVKESDDVKTQLEGRGSEY